MRHAVTVDYPVLGVGVLYSCTGTGRCVLRGTRDTYVMYNRIAVEIRIGTESTVVVPVVSKPSPVTKSRRLYVEAVFLSGEPHDHARYDTASAWWGCTRVAMVPQLQVYGVSAEQGAEAFNSPAVDHGHRHHTQH